MLSHRTHHLQPLLGGPTLSIADDRRAEIVRIVHQRGSISVLELISELGVSGATVRRDLQDLEEKHLLKRLHGVVTTPSPLGELPFQRKIAHLAEEKRRIALAASQLIQAGDVIGLSGGTTATYLAEMLRDREGLTVVTSAVNVAMTLGDSDDITVILVGGRVRPHTYELVGPLTDLVLPHIAINRLFLGVDGISLHGGITTHSDLEAHTNEAMLERAKELVVIADHTKVGKVTLATIAPLSRVGTLVTDETSTPDELEAIKAQGVNVILV